MLTFVLKVKCVKGCASQQERAAFRASLAILALLLCHVAGCKNSNELETAPASGKVLLDGKPLSRGTVTFVPPRGRVANGDIQSDGTFKLSTYRPNDGAIVGKHKAAVLVPNADLKPGMPPERDQSVFAIPPRYAVAEESGLQNEVKSGQANEFTLELSSK
jgi:hypothetical protein